MKWMTPGLAQAWITYKALGEKLDLTPLLDLGDQALKVFKGAKRSLGMPMEDYILMQEKEWAELLKMVKLLEPKTKQNLP